MITFSVLVLSVFVLPIAGSTVAFRYFFPKHAIRISDSYLVTVGTSLTVLINAPLFYWLFKIIIPNSVMVTPTDILYSVFQSLHKDLWCLILVGLLTIILPIAISTVSFCLMRYYFWNFHCANQELGPDQFKGWQKIRFKAGEFVTNSILNYMAKLTIYDEANEILIVDILDDQDSLYSGIFTDFFMEQGKFAGISLASVIRFSFKNEKERKESKTEDTDAENDKRQERPYILPRLGEMYFPGEKIQNLHFWKAKRGDVFQKKVKRPFDEAMIAWYLLLQNTYKKMNFSVKAHVDSPALRWPTFTKALERLPLDLSKLEIIVANKAPPKK